MGSACSSLCGSTSPEENEGHGLSRNAEGDKSRRVGLGGTFQAVKLLGRGATGEIWLFRDVKDHHEVAIKLFERPIPANSLRQFLREIQIQSDLGEGHINLIEVYEAILTPTHLCLVMEYARGGSLTQYVAERYEAGQRNDLWLTEEECRFFFRQFMTALSYCHSHATAHRDLKLDNTLLDGSQPPIIKICDFGFARTWNADLSRMSTQVGTPEYMSPEVLHTEDGKKQISYDPRSVDVWAAGVMLIVALTGTFPFDHTEHQDANTSEAQLEIWCACRWRDCTRAGCKHTGVYGHISRASCSEVHSRQVGGLPSPADSVAELLLACMCGHLFVAVHLLPALSLWLAYRLQEVTHKWSDAPGIACTLSKISPECRDLLDRIFVVDAKHRITVPEIMSHPWYTAPLSPKLEAGWKRLQRTQAAVDEHNRTRRLDQELVAARHKALADMVDEAAERPHGTPLQQLRPLHLIDFKKHIKRIDLTERTVLADPAAPPSPRLRHSTRPPSIEEAREPAPAAAAPAAAVPVAGPAVVSPFSAVAAAAPAGAPAAADGASPAPAAGGAGHTAAAATTANPAFAGPA